MQITSIEKGRNSESPASRGRGGPFLGAMVVKGVLVFEDVRAQRNCVASARPTGLEEVANQPIAHHVIDTLEAASVEEVIVVSSTEVAADVRASLEARRKSGSARLSYVDRPMRLDLAQGLGLAAPLVGEAACVAHVANGLLEEPIAPLIDRLQEGLPDLLLVVHQVPTPDEHLSSATLQMLRIAELHPDRAGLAMSGVSVFGPGALAKVGGLPLRVGTDVDLTGVGERIAATGGSFQVRVADCWCRYTGDTRDLLELNRMALDGLRAEPRRPDNHGNTIEGRVWIDERADVRASVIIGPALIGPSAHVKDAYIGPYTSVGPGARIEGAEVERSIISAGASIMHVGGRLVASVVGRDARIFRDFSLPRAMRLKVGDGTEVALC